MSDNSGTRSWPSMLLKLTLGLLVCAVLFGSGQLAAQISPGRLSEPHAELDGSADCLLCHQPRKGVDRDLCLECHAVLGQRIASGLGLHSGDDYQRCESCHIEHSGREFDLIWWGEAGRDAFDHREAGYTLEGAHSRLECGKCHNAQLIADPELLIAQDKDLERTFLGLETSCLSCHQDHHRGQVAADSCSNCHSLEAWKPATLFDHERTAFPLSNRHREVECTKCHRTVDASSDPQAGAGLEFRVVAFSRCTDCHRDPHDGRLGASCTECHSTNGWRAVDESRFSHERTRYPLRGKHVSLECVSCHPSGRRSSRVRAFEACTDCHSDSHLGQFDQREPTGGACESCHVVEGFSPSTYTLDLHQQTPYPLAGAHLAVPCVECHAAVAAADLAKRVPLRRLASEDAGVEVIQFRFDSTRCASCHQDSHAGDVDRYVSQSGCEGCHAVESWRQVAFDHNQTEFKLQGKHSVVECDKCHEKIDLGTASERIRMKGASSTCSACHGDPHLAQFDRPDGVADCSSCHGVEDWRTLSFDHNRDSRYPLEGAHARVLCQSCHLTEFAGGQELVRYKPLPTTCEACHSSEQPALR